ncbi:hypothetical protein BH11BAC1_BH11BAC1_23150 [soil metagenome]
MKFIGRQLDQQSKALVKNSKWIFIANVVGAGLGLIRSVFIARGLGAETFGTYVLVISFIALIQEFLNLNLGTAIIKFGAQFQVQNRLDKLVVMIKQSVKISFVMCTILIFIVTLLTLISYETFIKKPHLHWFVIGYAIANSVAYFNLITKASLRLFFKFKKNSIIQIILDFIETSLMVAAVLIYPKNLTMFFIAAIATRFLNGLVCNLMGFWEMKKELWAHRHAKNNLLKEELPVIRKYVLNNSLGNTIKAFMQQGDVLLLGTLAGTVSVGFYSVAKKLAFSLLTITDPLVNSIYPQISKLISEKRIGELQKMLVRITEIAALPALLFLIIGYFLNGWIITKVYGDGYLPASYPFFFLLINAAFGSVTFWVLPLIQGLGLVKLRLKVYTLMIIIGSVIAYFIVNISGASGMAISLLAVNIGINTIFIFASIKKMKPLAVNPAL